jgi:alkylglycerol monooxygenase
MLCRVARLLFRMMEVVGYMWMYNHCNIITLPWDHPVTWLLAFLGVDLGYYWLHRFGHGM